MQPDLNRIYTGDALSILKTWPDSFVHCCVTSPPYWGLRDYGVSGQFGLEKTPEEYVAKMVEVFREVRRVLRDDGTLWLNLGDSYAGSWGNYAPGGIKGVQRPQTEAGKRLERPAYTDTTFLPPMARVPGLKSKDLCGIPWRVAFALQADGWYLRSDIIWSKSNPMPESVEDRPTKAHEYIFLLAKSRKYYYDCEAVKEPISLSTIGRGPVDFGGSKGRATAEATRPGDPRYRGGPEGTQWGKTFDYEKSCANGRNKRSVWEIATEPFPEAHFATFPQNLVEPCVMAGTSEKGVCRKCGTPWHRIVEATGGTIGKGWHDHNDDLKYGMRNESCGKSTDETYHRETKEWKPKCDCKGGISRPIVLDPFMGSGTTALVALRLNRKFLGIELNPAYVKMAEARIANEKAQVKMF